MKQIGFLVLCLLVNVSFAFAQAKPEITVEKAIYDFGKINEEDGNASCEFIIKNTGKAPLVISRVSASCGCTTPDWTKSPIAPGATGTVKVTYAAKGRPGPFSKSIAVYTNAQERAYNLVIKGNVVPKAQSPEASYPVSMGDLRLKKSVSVFNLVSDAEKRQDIIEVYNNGKTPIQVSFFNLPAYLSASCSPASVSPGKTAQITLSYDGKAAGKYGSFSDKVGLALNGNKNSGYSLIVKSSVVEDFSKMTAAERQNAAILSVEPNSLVFSDLPKVKTAELKITNKGKSKLIIHNVQSEDPSILSVNTTKKEIKPGKSHAIKVSVDPSKVNRNTSVYINITCNDPTTTLKKVRVIVSTPSK